MGSHPTSSDRLTALLGSLRVSCRCLRLYSKRGRENMQDNYLRNALLPSLKRFNCPWLLYLFQYGNIKHVVQRRSISL